MFEAAVGIILVTVLITLAYPLWKRDSDAIPMGPEAEKEQERIDLEIEKQTLLNSLGDLDLDLAQGRLTHPDYERLKRVDEIRLGRVLDKRDALLKEGRAAESKSSKPRFQPKTVQWLGTAAMVVLVLGAATGIYSYIHGKIGLEAQRIAAERGAVPSAQGMPNPVEMVARLEKRLKENPNDLEGQIMAGRSYMTLQRLEDAQQAWGKVVELDYGNFEAHFNLGYILLQTTPRDDQKALEEALQHFETALVKVPREPVVLWYKGVVLVHLKQYSAADESWTAAYQNLAPGTQDTEFVKKALQDLRAGQPPLF